MYNILYITVCNIELNGGVEKKIKYQIDSLEKIGHQVQCLYASKKNICKYVSGTTTTLTEYKNSFNKRKKIYVEALNLINKENIDIIYIRYFKCDIGFLQFLNKIKKINKRVKILVEIPTYPYDEAIPLGLSKAYFLLVADRLLRQFLKFYVDNIVTFSLDKEIFGVTCINICNGIDLQKVRLITPIYPSSDFIFTSVSGCQVAHGIDRFLKSLDYFKIQNLKFNIVGEGPEIPKLKNIVETSDYLKGCVAFLGFLSGEDLDNVYNETNVAVGCLGRHREGVEIIRTLKTVEYTAKGLPTIFSENDPGFIGKPFIFKVKSDESIINLPEVINWRQQLCLTPSEIREAAKDFAMKKQMEKVINLC